MIRGGIVQASITEGGHKAEAISFYGHEMTVSNAGGATASMTQAGQGAVTSGSGGIQAMKPADVSAQIHSFNSSAQAGGDTAVEKKDARKKAETRPDPVGQLHLYRRYLQREKLPLYRPTLYAVGDEEFLNTHRVSQPGKLVHRLCSDITMRSACFPQRRAIRPQLFSMSAVLSA